jgi:hypothetical protein
MTKVSDKTIDQIQSQFPDFLPENLLSFVGYEPAA